MMQFALTVRDVTGEPVGIDVDMRRERVERRHRQQFSGAAHQRRRDQLTVVRNIW